MPRQRAAPGAPHPLVDVGVEHAVERVGASGRKGAADHGRDDQPELRDSATGEEHHRHGRQEQQLDDAGLGERHVGTDDVSPTRGTGPSLGGRGRSRGDDFPPCVGDPRHHRRGRGIDGRPMHALSLWCRAAVGRTGDPVLLHAVVVRPAAGRTRRATRRLTARAPNRRLVRSDSVSDTVSTSPHTYSPLEWTEWDRRAVDTVRTLAMDAVQKVGNGHPGTAMSLAPAAYLIYQKLMRHDPADPNWPARDRFVLSCGHSSLTQYIQLFYAGYGLELGDLQSLRTWGSRTPGHPENHLTPGIETTTGPLGQGVGNAVGMAMAARRRHGLLEPDTPLGEGVFDHDVYVIASDGDLEEGVSGEASSLAGHQELGNLFMLYDSNRISIEDDTNIAFSENVAKRYEGYGWHVQVVDWTNDGRSYEEDVPA